MSVFGDREYDGHSLVQFVNDPESGLRAIIALHRARPRAAGGIRMKPYTSEVDAVRDALRLSRAMSYKWAFAELPPGGGKTVIIGDPARDKTPALLHAIGRAIDALGGRYIAGSDVGTGSDDMRVIQGVTEHVRGADPEHGDTSKATAYGVMQGIRAAVKHAFGRDSLDGMTVAVQGVGNVGAHLCGMLHDRGVKLIVADVNSSAVEEMRANHEASIALPDDILFVEADVVAPCALGGIIDEAAVDRIQAKVICGAANNQLACDEIASVLDARGVLFVPDYTVNSGGIITGFAEGEGYDAAAVRARLDRIYDQCLEVFKRAEADGTSSLEAANLISERLMADAG